MQSGHLCVQLVSVAPARQNNNNNKWNFPLGTHNFKLTTLNSQLSNLNSQLADCESFEWAARATRALQQSSRAPIFVLAQKGLFQREAKLRRESNSLPKASQVCPRALPVTQERRPVELGSKSSWELARAANCPLRWTSGGQPTGQPSERQTKAQEQQEVARTRHTLASVRAALSGEQTRLLQSPHLVFAFHLKMRASL